MSILRSPSRSCKSSCDLTSEVHNILSIIYWASKLVRLSRFKEGEEGTLPPNGGMVYAYKELKGLMVAILEKATIFREWVTFVNM